MLITYPRVKITTAVLQESQQEANVVCIYEKLNIEQRTDAWLNDL